MSDAAAVVRRYFEVVADLGSSVDALIELLDPDVRVIERPNVLNPQGAVRDHDGVVTGFLAGKDLLSAQEFDVQEVVAS